MTDPQLQTVILEELRAIAVVMRANGERLAKIETHVEGVVGNAQPGRLTIVEKKVSDLQQWRWTTTGIYIGISSLVSVATAFVYHLWK